MSDAESPIPGAEGPVDPTATPARTSDGRTDRDGTLVEEPVSSSWPVVTAPWGTPGNHLTGPIPRIRRRRDGSLTHGHEDDGAGPDRAGEES